MQDYILANMAAYEDTAEEFQTQKAIRLGADNNIADAFAAFVEKGGSVLELGTGSGQLARLLCERGLMVDAIEYSPKMARLAARTAPEAHVLTDEFLGHDFGSKRYDGIIGVAFVHLFKAEDAKRVMDKIHGLLLPGGVVTLTTTLHEKTFDDLVRKTNFKTEVYRFRRHYTKRDFESLFTESGFTVRVSAVDHDSNVGDKRWITVSAVRS